MIALKSVMKLVVRLFYTLVGLQAGRKISAGADVRCHQPTSWQRLSGGGRSFAAMVQRQAMQQRTSCMQIYVSLVNTASGV